MTTHGAGSPTTVRPAGARDARPDSSRRRTFFPSKSLLFSFAEEQMLLTTTFLNYSTPFYHLRRRPLSSSCTAGGGRVAPHRHRQKTAATCACFASPHTARSDASSSAKTIMKKLKKKRGCPCPHHWAATPAAAALAFRSDSACAIAFLSASAARCSISSASNTVFAACSALALAASCAALVIGFERNVS